MMFWLPLMAGLLNAAFILDLMVTVFTGRSLAETISGTAGNSVAEAVVANIPTDPLLFWTLMLSILVIVCTIECVVIYVAFYSDISQCATCFSDNVDDSGSQHDIVNGASATGSDIRIGNIPGNPLDSVIRHGRFPRNPSGNPPTNRHASHPYGDSSHVPAYRTMSRSDHKGGKT